MLKVANLTKTNKRKSSNAKFFSVILMTLIISISCENKSNNKYTFNTSDNSNLNTKTQNQNTETQNQDNEAPTIKAETQKTETLEPKTETLEPKTETLNKNIETSNHNGYNYQFNEDLLKWIKDTNEIQTYLPSEWEPLKVSEADRHYYLEATCDSESYSINVYRTKLAINFNDRKDLLGKNGPISEADYVGTISGNSLNNKTLSFNIPDGSRRFRLIKGITAYEDVNRTSVWWSENDWNFTYFGMDNRDTLEELAKVWSKGKIMISDSGNVEIVEGNRLTFNYSWVKDGYKYSFISRDTDFENILEILNSFIKIR